MTRANPDNTEVKDLPDYYETVAGDALDYVGRREGVWMDVGRGWAAMAGALLSVAIL